MSHPTRYTRRYASAFALTFSRDAAIWRLRHRLLRLEDIIDWTEVASGHTDLGLAPIQETIAIFAEAHRAAHQELYDQEHDSQVPPGD